jgi:hypothetical protein
MLPPQMTPCLSQRQSVVVSKRVITALAWRLPCIANGGMRVRYTFEIVTLALLMAAGSILRPAAPASGCHLPSATVGPVMTTVHLSHLAGGRG